MASLRVGRRLPVRVLRKIDALGRRLLGIRRTCLLGLRILRAIDEILGMTKDWCREEDWRQVALRASISFGERDLFDEASRLERLLQESMSRPSTHKVPSLHIPSIHKSIEAAISDAMLLWGLARTDEALKARAHASSCLREYARRGDFACWRFAIAGLAALIEDDSKDGITEALEILSRTNRGLLSGPLGGTADVIHWRAGMQVGTFDGVLNEQFAERISGRTVALVAPGGSAELLGTEIESADVVYRIKPRFDRAGSGIAERTDIAYLQPRDIEQMSSLGLEKHIPEGCLLVGRVKLGGSNFGALPIRALPTRVALPMRKALAGINVLFDLLRTDARSIRLYGFDLYSQPARYLTTEHDYRRRRGQKLGIGTASLRRIFLNQDLVGDFCFLRNAVNHDSRVTVTGPLRDILREGVDAYVRALARCVTTDGNETNHLRRAGKRSGPPN